MQVLIENVGRAKKTWTIDVPDCSISEVLLGSVLKSVRASGALRSQDIELEWDNDRGAGTIFVGMLRPVGTFRLASCDCARETDQPCPVHGELWCHAR